MFLEHLKTVKSYQTQVSTTLNQTQLFFDFEEILSYLMLHFLRVPDMIKATFLFDKWQKKGVLPNSKVTRILVNKLLASGNERKVSDINSGYFVYKLISC